MTELTPERRKELLRIYLELKTILANPVQRAMYEAVPDSLMRDIVNDHRRGVSPPSSLATTPGEPPRPPRGTGWADPAPLGPPPGINYIDQMMDAQDARDRAALIVDSVIDQARRGMISRAVEPTPDTHRAPATRPTEPPAKSESNPPPGGHPPKQSKGSV
jgi:hypothetical protein